MKASPTSIKGFPIVDWVSYCTLFLLGVFLMGIAYYKLSTHRLDQSRYKAEHWVPHLHLERRLFKAQSDLISSQSRARRSAFIFLGYNCSSIIMQLHYLYGSFHSLGSQLRSLPIRFHLKLHRIALSLQDLVVVGSEVFNLGVELRLHPWIWEVWHTVQRDIYNIYIYTST